MRRKKESYSVILVIEKVPVPEYLLPTSEVSTVQTDPNRLY